MFLARNVTCSETVNTTVFFCTEQDFDVQIREDLF